MNFLQYLPYAMAVLTTILAIIFIYCRFHKSIFRSFGMKAITGVFFIITAMTAYLVNPSNPIYATLIVIGGLFGLLGDIFLALKSISPQHFKKLVGVGMLFFALGHVFYFISILTSTNITIYPFLIAIIPLVVAYFILSTKKFSSIGSIKIPALVYYYILSTTLIQSIFGAVDGTAMFSVVFMIGTCFFFVSDSLLSFMYFGGAKGRAYSIVNLSTYYIAQILIALSILFI